MTRHGLNWNGAKRDIAEDICTAMERLDPRHNKTIVEPFCGGASMTAAMLIRGWDVHASDVNQSMICLLEAVFWKDELAGIDLANHLGEPFFVTREMFFDALKERDAGNHSWYTGMVQSIYSFGGNQKDYMFGKNVEPMKHAGHNVAVFQDAAMFSEYTDSVYSAQAGAICDLPTIKDRRLAFKKLIKEAKASRLGELEQLERLEQLQQLQRLEQLQQLQQLQQLEQLQQLQQLELRCCDYKTAFEDAASKDCIVYCDPPYKGTAGYASGTFDHDTFWDDVRELSEHKPVFVSELNAPSDFISIWGKPTSQRMSSKGISGKRQEKLLVHHTLYSQTCDLTLFTDGAA